MKEGHSFHSVHFKSVFLMAGVRCCVAPTIFVIASGKSSIAAVIFAMLK
jgi:hypothetical protein